MTDLIYWANRMRGKVQRVVIGKRLDERHECRCGCERWPFHCGPCWVCGR